ncbi:MAG: TonB-dependent receptor plug domain-containing protein, partial [Bacteroidales bacterium]|nr:TonB-dependent receptor plug domain-containing protein [Bacteroidales bacterium]
MKKHSFAIFLIFACACAVSAQTHPEDSLVLEESVVIGMGTQKRGSITASVSTVSSEEVAYRPVTDITGALQGYVAGLTVSSDAVASGVGGEPGAGIDFMIRGTGSINGGGPYVL